jgi:hypothetical protein
MRTGICFLGGTLKRVFELGGGLYGWSGKTMLIPEDGYKHATQY